MNIFGSKSGHLSKSNKWGKKIHFLGKNFSRVPNVMQNLEKSSNIAKKNGGNEENISDFTIILMAAFGTNNVHSAL